MPRLLLSCQVALLLLCPVSASRAAEVTSPRYRVIAADNDRIVLFDRDGTPLWQLEDVGPVHRIQQLDNGNILTQDGWTRLIEVNPQKEIVWTYDATTQEGVEGRKIELHAFQRLPGGHTMIVENGIGRVIEVDAAGQIQHQFHYAVSTLNAHRDVRQGHRLPGGHSLLCHEGDGRVTEYGSGGDIIWSFDVPLFGKRPAKGHGPEAWGNQVFNAVRLPTGNTLISTGNGHGVIEVTPAGEIVWSLQQHDLEGITFAWTTSIEVLPTGNLLIGNCHAGPDNPQFIEVTREKEVVWTFHDFDLLGNATAVTATVGVEGIVR